MTWVIVDGYNLIRQSASLSQIELNNFEKGRSVLIDRLAAYRRIKRVSVTVVFDAWQTDKAYRDQDIINGIQVIYSQGGETADEAILELIAEKRAQKVGKEDIVLISSDRGLGMGAQQYGCLVMSAREFEAIINNVGATPCGRPGGHMGPPLREFDKQDKEGGRLSTKKKGVSRRLPKQRRRAAQRAKI